MHYNVVCVCGCTIGYYYILADAEEQKVNISACVKKEYTSNISEEESDIKREGENKEILSMKTVTDGSSFNQA